MNESLSSPIGKFTLRSSAASTSKTTGSQARRVVLNVTTLRDNGIASGDLLLIRIASRDRNITSPNSLFVGIAWPSTEIPSQHVMLSATGAERIQGARAGNMLCVEKLKPSSINQATQVSLMETTTTTLSRFTKDGDKESVGSSVDWLTIALRETLGASLLMTTMGENSCDMQIKWEGRPRSFRIVKIESHTDTLKSQVPNIVQQLGGLSLSEIQTPEELKLWLVDWSCGINIVQPKDTVAKPIESIDGSTASQSSPYEAVGGLSKQIDLIRDLIEIPITRPSLFAHFNLKPPRGLLLYGPPGTGKTHLARAIAASTHANIIVVNGPELSSAYHGESEKKLREVFERAENTSPCIVVLDEVDAICPKRGDGEGDEVGKRVVATLLTILDGMDEPINSSRNGETHNGGVVVVATTNRPNAIDPALRRPGRFDREIEIGIPDAIARLEILQILLKKTPHDLSVDQLQLIASQTHGYVGADLAGLVREAGTSAIKRQISVKASHDRSDHPSVDLVTYSDFLRALPSTRPSALRSLILETPRVYWSDIGGVSHIRNKLKEAIEWPLLYPETFTRLGVAPTKGVLLYGPPGCSKTLTAKALATESGINFLAVKGPELLNKFVGESERAVREVFAKARAGAPCIVFFDEIDALGTARGGDGLTGAHEGVLTSMLNEMDGIQDLHGVIIVAATNRPDVMDSALMRPGRLDRILYVGPPDQAGREEILRVLTKKMTIDPGVDFGKLSLMTEGCSGAELAAVCQEAAMNAMREDLNALFVSRAHFETAAGNARRGITTDVVARFKAWRERSGLAEV